MRRLATSAALTLALASAAVLVASGCSATAGPAGSGGVDATDGTAELSDEDQRILAALAPLAARDAGLASDEELREDPGAVECWAPSAHMVDEASFRVICRVHFEQAGAQRYRDVICIGEPAREPVADHCYPWAYYSDMPAFEDEPAYAA